MLVAATQRRDNLLDGDLLTSFAQDVRSAVDEKKDSTFVVSMRVVVC